MPFNCRSKHISVEPVLCVRFLTQSFWLSVVWSGKRKTAFHQMPVDDVATSMSLFFWTEIYWVLIEFPVWCGYKWTPMGNCETCPIPVNRPSIKGILYYFLYYIEFSLPSSLNWFKPFDASAAGHFKWNPFPGKTKLLRVEQLFNLF